MEDWKRVDDKKNSFNTQQNIDNNIN